MDQGEGVEGADRKEDPLDFALWKAQKEGEDTSWDSPWGRGPAGLAHRVLGDGRGAAGRRLRHPRRRLDLVFPHHENEAAQTLAGARRAARAALDAQRDARSSATRRWPSRSATSALLHEALDDVGPRRAGHVLRRRPLPPAARLLATSAWRRRPRGVRAHPRGGPAPAPRRRRRRTWRRCATRFFDALRRRLQHRRGAGRAVRLDPRGQPARRRRRRRRPARDARACSGWRTCSRPDDGRAGRRSSSWPRRAQRGARGARLRRGRPPARRARARAAGRSATARGRRPSSCRVGVIVYGRNPVREALRGPRRGARGCGRREGARLERGCAGSTRRSSTRPSIERAAAARTPTRACAREVDAYPLRRRRRAARRARAAARRARRGHGPAEPRRGLPDGRGRRARPAWSSPSAARPRSRRRSARRRRARSSTCAIARVRNLADFLGDAKAGRVLGLRRRRRRAHAVRRSPDYRGGVVLVLGAEGRGLRPRVAAACDELVALPLRGRIDVAQRERRRGGAAVRDLAAAA